MNKIRNLLVGMLCLLLAMPGTLVARCCCSKSARVSCCEPADESSSCCQTCKSNSLEASPSCCVSTKFCCCEPNDCEFSACDCKLVTSRVSTAYLIKTLPSETFLRLSNLDTALHGSAKLFLSTSTPIVGNNERQAQLGVWLN